MSLALFPTHMGGVSLQSAGALPHTANGRISRDVLQIFLLLKKLINQNAPLGCNY